MANAPSTASRAQEFGARPALVWIGLVAALGVLIWFRLHAFVLPLETDECNYAYIGGRLLEGDRLYEDVWDHQPPGVFAMFAGVIALFGDAPGVFRMMAMCFSAASLALIFVMLHRWYGGLTAVGGAILFALVSSDPGTAGEGCNREIYMNTCVMAAWMLALAGARPSRGRVFGAGLALGIGSTIKTILAVHWAALAVLLVIRAMTDAGSPAARPRPSGASRGESLMTPEVTQARVGRHPPTMLGLLGWLALGSALVWTATAGYFAVTGRWPSFIDAVFLFNLSYAEGSGGFFTRFATFFDPPGHPYTFDSAIGLWWGGVVGAILIVLRYVVRPGGGDVVAAGASPVDVQQSRALGGHRLETGATRLKPAARGDLAILGLSAASFLAVCLPARFWPHYYHLLVPPMVLLCAGGAKRLFDLIRPAPWRKIIATGAYGVLLIAVAATQYRDYLSQPPLGITIKRYNTRDFWGRAQGEHIRRVTDPEDTIFVCGNDASLYYYADRRCASRFTMITGVTSSDPRVGERRATLRDELSRDPPRLIIVSEPAVPFDDWHAFLEEHYGPAVGADLHDRNRAPIMLVFARKDAPIVGIDWDWDRSEVTGSRPPSGAPSPPR